MPQAPVVEVQVDACLAITINHVEIEYMNGFAKKTRIPYFRKSSTIKHESAGGFIVLSRAQ